MLQTKRKIDRISTYYMNVKCLWSKKKKKKKVPYGLGTRNVKNPHTKFHVHCVATQKNKLNSISVENFHNRMENWLFSQIMKTINQKPETIHEVQSLFKRKNNWIVLFDLISGICSIL